MCSRSRTSTEPDRIVKLCSNFPERSNMLVSEELFAQVSPGIELCYQTFGDPTDEPLLLVMGLGGPMTWWDSKLCSQLADQGFFVVRYDNRDTGKSTKVRARVTRPMLVKAFAGARVAAPYSINDLAADAFGLMDHLGWKSAHVTGVSMGGMIAQTMAIAAPERVRSLTSIMSTIGKRTVGWQHPKLLPILLAPTAPGRTAYTQAAARRLGRSRAQSSYSSRAWLTTCQSNCGRRFPTRFGVRRTAPHSSPKKTRGRLHR